MMIGSALTFLGSGLWHRSRKKRKPVFLAGNQTYDKNLTRTIRDGLQACGLSKNSIVGRRVLLKPNLVEPLRDVPHMTTHPAVIVATIEVFRDWGADILVGEAPGHVRDTDMALEESGVQAALDDTNTTFADLNYEDVVWTANRGNASSLDGFFFPQSIATADLVVSLPKFKTHHWVGLTAAMKNLYGTLPGIKYGWPKNVLHHAGVPETVFDINASLPRTVSIVDGIDCMEGDGPIMGTAKHLGLIAVGSNLPALDATLARIMGLDARRVSYLALAADRLGPICPRKINQRGDSLDSLVSPFQLVDFPHIQDLRDRRSGEKVT
jgi:uncharacterized protein (DUF362 family)